MNKEPFLTHNGQEWLFIYDSEKGAISFSKLDCIMKRWSNERQALSI
jgi:hypothetical protein